MRQRTITRNLPNGTVVDSVRTFDGVDTTVYIARCPLCAERLLQSDDPRAAFTVARAHGHDDFIHVEVIGDGRDPAD